MWYFNLNLIGANLLSKPPALAAWYVNFNLTKLEKFPLTTKRPNCILDPRLKSHTAEGACFGGMAHEVKIEIPRG